SPAAPAPGTRLDCPRHARPAAVSLLRRHNEPAGRWAQAASCAGAPDRRGEGAGPGLPPARPLQRPPHPAAPRGGAATAGRRPRPQSRDKLPAGGRRRDEPGSLPLFFSHANRQWLERTFKPGVTVIASGLVDDYKGGRQMTHPDHVTSPEKDDELPEVEPVYP